MPQRKKADRTQAEMARDRINGAKGGRPKNPRIDELPTLIGDMARDDAPCRDKTLAIIPVEDLPKHLQGIPDKAIAVMCMRARGIEWQRISDDMGLCMSTVTRYIQTYDPRGVFCSSPEIRQKLAYVDWLSIQAKAQQIALDKADEISGPQAVVMAGIAADKLRDVKKLQQDDKRIDLIGDASVLNGLKTIEAECH